MSFINVLFKRVTTAILGTETIQDGKILLDYERPSIYVDNGSTRVELTPRDIALSTTSTNAIANNALTNSIINTTAEVSAITADNIPCGTKPVKELITSLNGLVFEEISAGKWGYKIGGADPVIPFSSARRDIITTFNTSTTSAKYLILKVEDTLSTKIVRTNVAPAYNDELISSVTYSVGNYNYTLAVDCYVNEIMRSAGYVFTLNFADATTVYTVRAK